MAERTGGEIVAEFSKVMCQWRRFCKSHNNCGECEFDGKGICGDAHLTDIPYADIELRIMAWAAEHPEPVYPTWMEWLTDLGAIPKAISWDEPLVEAVYDAIQAGFTKIVFLQTLTPLKLYKSTTFE